MTCIVGITDGKKVYLAGDSAGVAGLDVSVRADKKVFKNKKFVMGFTSSFRMGDILKHRFVPPSVKKGMPLDKYMATDFVDAVRACFKKYAYGKLESGEQTGGTFLVGYKGRLFEIEDDFQVAEQVLPFASCGCGYYYAMGSMYNDYKSGKMLKDPEKTLERALEVASTFSGGVLPPFNFVTT